MTIFKERAIKRLSERWADLKAHYPTTCSKEDYLKVNLHYGILNEKHRCFCGVVFCQEHSF